MQPHDISRLVDSIQSDHQTQMSSMHRKLELLTTENKQLQTSLSAAQAELERVCFQ